MCVHRGEKCLYQLLGTSKVEIFIVFKENVVRPKRRFRVGRYTTVSRGNVTVHAPRSEILYTRDDSGSHP